MDVVGSTSGISRFWQMAATVLLTLAIGWILSSGAAIANQCRPNGCGPEGWGNALVPDKIGDCNFKSACDKHDVCYARCEKCGDLYGSKSCEGTCEQKRDRKDRCDTRFYQDMVRANVGKSICEVAAKAYYYAVSFAGCSFFRDVGGDTQARLARDKVAKNFEAAFRYLQANPDRQRQLDAELALKQLSLLDAEKENALIYSEPSGSLALKARNPARSRGAGQGAGNARIIVNGIDLTESTIVTDGRGNDPALQGLKIERKPAR